MRGPVQDTVYHYLGSILLIALFIASKAPESLQEDTGPRERAAVG